MNSKERVRAAIAREPVDRVPLGLYVADCDTIERVIGRKTYVRNKIAAQVALWEGRREEVVESYKQDTVEFYEKLGCVDLICFKEAPVVPPKDYEPDPPRRLTDETWEDRGGRIYKASTLSNELVCVHDPTRHEVEDFDESMFPEFDASEYQSPDPSVFEVCDYLIEKLGPERYIAGTSGGAVAMSLLGGMTTGLMIYALRPEVARAASRRTAQWANCADRDYVRPGQDGALLEEDLAGTNGPFISPGLFREHCLPFFAERVAHVKAMGKQVLFHSCGDNRLLMEMYIDAGVECYQSLQTTAGMDLATLKARYGDRVCLMGNIEIERLAACSPADVRRAVLDAVNAAAHGGGFILSTSSGVIRGPIPPAHVLAISEVLADCHSTAIAPTGHESAASRQHPAS